MKITIRTTAAICLLLLFSVTASAEPPASEERQVTYKQRTEIDFEGVEVQGALVRPQGALILDRKAGNFNPLIELRTDFDDEINKSIDFIK
tara:strand:- start:214 stop:486 length:273 start_codon:yes stop_codon:yes gene_type:complete